MQDMRGLIRPVRAQERNMDSSLSAGVLQGKRTKRIRGMSFDTRCVKTGTRVMICTRVDSKGTGSKGHCDM